MRYKVKYIDKHGYTEWWLEPGEGMTRNEAAAYNYTEKELSRTAFKEARRYKPGSGCSGVRLKLVP